MALPIDTSTLQGPSESTSGGTEICLTVSTDGSLSVYKESAENEGAGEQSAKPAADIGAALKMILDLYREIAADGGDAQAQFASGVAKATGRSGMMP